MVEIRVYIEIRLYIEHLENDKVASLLWHKMSHNLLHHGMIDVDAVNADLTQI